MGADKHITKTFQKEWKGVHGKNYNYRSIFQQRLIDFRKEKSAVVKINKPTNIPRAKKVGYKAKEGILVARVRIRRGSGMHERPRMGRRPKRLGVLKLTRRKSIQAIAEERASRKFENCEVLGSYKIGDDGVNHYYEVILVNVSHPAIKKDRKLKWVVEGQKGRAERGKTRAGRVNKRANKTNLRKKKKKANK